MPGTELPEDEDPDRPAPHGLISLEDIRAPWSRLRELEDERSRLTGQALVGGSFVGRAVDDIPRS